MSLLDDLVYVTLEEVEETSTILASLDDDVITKLVTKSQYAIDAYIGRY